MCCRSARKEGSVQSRHLQELADELRLRHIPSFETLHPQAQARIILACSEALRIPDIRSQAAFDDLRRKLPREIGDSLCFLIGLNLLLWARGNRPASLPDAAVDLIARHYVLGDKREPLDISDPLRAQVLLQADIVEFFWLDDTPWCRQPEGRRQKVLLYLQRQAYAGRRHGLPEADRPLHERLGSHEIDEKLYRLMVRNQAVLHDLIGAFGAMLFQTAVDMNMHSLPPAALPFVASHIARASMRGEDPFATDGITLELNQQLVNYRGKTADGLWLI